MSDPLFRFRLVRATLEHLGVSEDAARQMAEQSGLPERALDKRTVLAPISKIREFMALAALSSSEPDFSLRLAHSVPLGVYGLMEMVCRTSATLGDSCRFTARFAPIINQVLRFEFDEDNATMVLRTRVDIGWVLEEFVVFYVLRVLACYVQEPPRILRVRLPERSSLPARSPDVMAGYQLVVGDLGFDLDPRDIDREQLTHAPVVHAYLLHQAEKALRKFTERPFAAVLADVLMSEVGLSMASLESAADALELSPRTIQRRLKSDGLSFMDVLDNLRRREVRELYTNGAPMALIAKRVGFANAASLRRAMGRWTDAE